MSRSVRRSHASGDGSCLVPIFDQKKQAFISSLEKVISVVGSDLYVRQMFEDDNSMIFVPNRICELVTCILEDDREQFLQQLLLKLQSIEACFGPSQSQRLQEIGAKIVEISSSQNVREAEYRQVIRMLREQIALIEAELAIQHGEFSGMNIMGDVSRHAEALRGLAHAASVSVGMLQRSIRESIDSAKNEAVRVLEEVVDRSRQDLPTIDAINEQRERDMARMRRKVQKARDVSHGREDEAEALRAQIVTMKRHKDLETKARERQDEATKAEMDKLRKDLRDLKAANVHAMREMEKTTEDKWKFKHEIKERAGSMRELRSAVVDLNDQIAQLKEISEESEMEIGAANDRNESLVREARDLKAQLDDEAEIRKSLYANARENERKTAALQQSIWDRDNEIKELEDAIEQQAAVIGRHEEEMAKAREDRDAEIARLRKVYEEKADDDRKRHDADVEEINARAESEVARLKDQEKAEAERQDEVARKLQSKLKEGAAEGARLEGEIREARIANARAAEQAEARERKAEAQQQKVTAELQAQIHDLREADEEKNNTIESVERANDELTAKVRELQSITAKDKGNAAQQKRELEKLTRENAELTETVRTADKDALQLHENLKNAQNELRQAAFAQERLQHSIKKLEAEKDALDTTVSDGNDRMREYAKALTDKEAEIERLGDAMEAVKRENEAQIVEKDEEARRLNICLKSMKAESEGQMSQKNAEIMKLTNKLEDAKTEAQRKGTDVGNRNSEIDTLRQEVAAKDGEIEECKKEIRRQDALARELSGQLEEAKKTIQRKDAANHELDDKLEECGKEIERKDAVRDELDDEVEKCKKEIQQRDARARELIGQIEDGKKEIRQKDTLASQLSGRVEECQQEIERKDALVRELGDRVEECQQEIERKDTLVRELGDQIEEGKQGIEEKDALVGELSGQIEALNAHIAELSEEREELEKVTEDQSLTISRVLETLNGVQAEQREQAQDFSDSAREAEEANSKLQQALMESEAAVESVTADNDRLVQCVQKLQFESDERRDENDQLMMRLGAQDDKVKELRQEIDRQNALITADEMVIGKLKRSVARKARQIETLEEDCASRERLIHSRRLALDEMKDGLAKSSSEIESLGASLEEHQETTEKERKAYELKLESMKRKIDELKRVNKAQSNDNETQIGNMLYQCGVSSLDDIPALVDELRSSSAKYRDIVDRLRDIVGDDPIAGAQRIKKDSEEFRKLKVEAMPLMSSASEMIDDVVTTRNARREMGAREKEVMRVLGLKHSREMVDAVTVEHRELMRLHATLEKLQRELHVDSGDDIISSVSDLVREKQSVEQRLKSDTRAGTVGRAFQEIAGMTRCLGSLRKLVNVEANEAVVDAVADGLRRGAFWEAHSEEMMRALSAGSADDVFERISDLQNGIDRFTEMFDGLKMRLKCGDNDIVEAVNKLISNLDIARQRQDMLTEALEVTSTEQGLYSIKRMRGSVSILQDVAKLIRVTQYEAIPAAVADVVDNTGYVTSICAALKCSSRGNVLGMVTDLVQKNREFEKERREMSARLRTSEFVNAIDQLIENESSVVQLISRIFSVLSSSPMTIKLPLSSSVKERLVRIVTNFRIRAETAERGVNEVMRCAHEAGYIGDDVGAAIDYISAARSDVVMQRMMDDLTELRETSAEERGAANKYRQKKNAKISELRAKLNEVQEAKMRREDDIMETLAVEKKKVRSMTFDLQSERKIREELIGALSGSAVDSDFLRSKLSAKELSLLKHVVEC